MRNGFVSGRNWLISGLTKRSIEAVLAERKKLPRSAANERLIVILEATIPACPLIRSESDLPRSGSICITEERRPPKRAGIPDLRRLTPEMISGLNTETKPRR